MNLASNVVSIYDNPVFNDIMTFINGKKSVNTQKNYKKDIEQFFQYVKNKELKYLTINDVESVRNADMVSYQTYWKSKTDAHATIKRKLDSVKSLYSYLKRNEYNVKPENLQVEHYAYNGEKIGILELSESLDMINRTEDSQMKAFLMIALETSARKKSILQIKWSDIAKSRDEDDMYVIRVFDKQKQIYKQIHSDVYEFICKYLKRGNSEYVFDYKVSQIDYRFNLLVKEIGIEDERNISVHSIKKSGVNYVLQLAGVYAARDQASHSSVQVTEKFYLDKPKNILSRALHTKIEKNIIDKVNHEMLLEAIHKLDDATKFKLEVELQKMKDAQQ